MKVLVVGASGATGRYVVEQLLIQKYSVKVIVRSPEKLPELWKANDALQIISASILELSDKEMNDYVSDCNAIISCLGHNLTWKGVYGQQENL